MDNKKQLSAVVFSLFLSITLCVFATIINLLIIKVLSLFALTTRQTVESLQFLVCIFSALVVVKYFCKKFVVDNIKLASFYSALMFLFISLIITGVTLFFYGVSFDIIFKAYLVTVWQSIGLLILMNFVIFYSLKRYISK